ncbi:Hsp20/alpha crystallin family protein [Sulfurospirillum arcachonense]|uniref:Hsp20/alpha crystallin family protein n=1 Tax=Sulfurospirillum arcachonense TaxID=57666 RepID=UPI000468F7B2|nr:Hsp20/alpha crystallin family protein [Sulfurospirillum arcachonense]
MLLTKFDPFKEFANMQRSFLDTRRDDNEMSINAFVPKVNTRELDDAYYIDVDLPGIKKEDIDIDIHDGMLTIKGERNFKDEIKEEDYYKVETSFGKFQRAFSVPDNIDTENISASYENGVLEVTVPKLAKDINRKKISIK